MINLSTFMHDEKYGGKHFICEKATFDDGADALDTRDDAPEEAGIHSVFECATSSANLVFNVKVTPNGGPSQPQRSCLPEQAPIFRETAFSVLQSTERGGPHCFGVPVLLKRVIYGHGTFQEDCGLPDQQDLSLAERRADVSEKGQPEQFSRQRENCEVSLFNGGEQTFNEEGKNQTM